MSGIWKRAWSRVLIIVLVFLFMQTIEVALYKTKITSAAYLTPVVYLCIGFLVFLKKKTIMNSIQLLGLFAGTLTTAAFLPQVIKTWKSRSAKDLSLGMFSLFCLGVMLWLVYGIMVRDIPVIAANLVTLMLASTLLVFKLRFKNQ